MPEKPPRSPLSRREREAQKREIRAQLERGELTPEQARAALAPLDSPPVLRG